VLNKIKKHWQSIVIGLLCVGLIVLGSTHVSLLEKHEKAQTDYEWARESLERSALELVEVRKKLVPRDFEDYEELVGWVADWEKDNKPIAVSILNHTFVLSGNRELYSRYWDCDDISEAMQRDARIDGFVMDRALTDSRGAICDIKVSEHAYHAGNMVVAGNAYWWIEPQSGEIVRIVSRD